MYNDQLPGSSNELNGRGIGKALIMLDDLRYADKGNEVHCNIYLDIPMRAGGVSRTNATSTQYVVSLFF